MMIDLDMWSGQTTLKSSLLMDPIQLNTIRVCLVVMQVYLVEGEEDQKVDQKALVKEGGLDQEVGNQNQGQGVGSLETRDPALNPEITEEDPDHRLDGSEDIPYLQ